MEIEKIRLFRDKIAKRAVYGPFCKTSDPAFIETAGYAGFDFVILDLEHAPNSVETLQNLIRGAYLGGALPIVRVKEYNYSYIGEVLDIGAGGIQAPKITCREDAEKIIEHAKFAPDGMRGVCRFVRAARYSAMDRFEYFREANNTLVVLQLESSNAIENVEDILKVKGIDIVFIGPYDLSQSLGIPGQVEHPMVEKRMKEIADICSEKGIHTGTFVDTIQTTQKRKKAGLKYISNNVDAGIFYEACKKILGDIG